MKTNLHYIGRDLGKYPNFLITIESSGRWEIAVFDELGGPGYRIHMDRRLARLLYRRLRQALNDR